MTKLDWLLDIGIALFVGAWLSGNLHPYGMF
jgi:hypothetical protein